MVLKCELKQVKHDTKAGCKRWTRYDIKGAIIASAVAIPTLVIIKLTLSIMFYAIAAGYYTISFIALIMWMRDVRKKCNARRERNVNKFGDDNV